MSSEDVTENKNPLKSEVPGGDLYPDKSQTADSKMLKVSFTMYSYQITMIFTLNIL